MHRANASGLRPGEALDADELDGEGEPPHPAASKARTVATNATAVRAGRGLAGRSVRSLTTLV
jgi:hypothetical protein